MQGGLIHRKSLMKRFISTANISLAELRDSRLTSSGSQPCWMHIPDGIWPGIFGTSVDALVLCTTLNAAAEWPASRQLQLMSLHRLRTASPIRATISLSIADGVAKFSRANPA